MFSLLPQFHYHSCQDGSKVLRLGYTEEAKRLLKQRKGNPPPRTTSLPPSLVRQKAIEALTRLGGDCTNELQVLGQHEVQFGVFNQELKIQHLYSGFKIVISLFNRRSPGE